MRQSAENQVPGEYIFHAKTHHIIIDASQSFQKKQDGWVDHPKERSYEPVNRITGAFR